MKNPTHFIEVYGCSNLTPFYTPFPLVISHLSHNLLVTKNTMHFHTIAIFKIKFKQNDTTPHTRSRASN